MPIKKIQILVQDTLQRMFPKDSFQGLNKTQKKKDIYPHPNLFKELS